MRFRSGRLAETRPYASNLEGDDRMKTLAQFVRTTILGGVIFLAPIVVLIVILAKALDGHTRRCRSRSRSFGIERGHGDGAFDRYDRACLPSCRAHRSDRDCPTPRQRIGGVGAVEDSSLRVSETGERERLGRSRDWRASPCVRAHGRGMAARRSNGGLEQRPRLDLRPRRAEPSLRLGLFLLVGYRSACRHQARRWARLPAAMRRRRIRSGRQLAIRRRAGIVSRYRLLSPDEKHADIARYPVGKVDDPGRKMETLRLQIMAPS